jgi:hypothetical protein
MVSWGLAMLLTSLISACSGQGQTRSAAAVASATTSITSSTSPPNTIGATLPSPPATIPPAIPAAQEIILVCGDTGPTTGGSDVAILDAGSGSVLRRQHFVGQPCPGRMDRFAYNNELTCLAGTERQSSGEILAGCYQPNGTFLPAVAPTANTSGFGITLHDAKTASYQPKSDKLWWVDDPGINGQAGADSFLVDPAGNRTRIIIGNGNLIMFDSSGSPVILGNTTYTAGYVQCSPISNSEALTSCGETGGATQPPTGSNITVTNEDVNAVTKAGALAATTSSGNCNVYVVDDWTSSASTPKLLVPCPDADDATTYGAVRYIGTWGSLAH